MGTPITTKSRRWIWYFVVLFALAFLATAVLIVFNLKQQLKPEQLAAARALWQAKGPRDYTMSYRTRIDSEANANHYWVKVRGGRVVDSKFNDQAESPQLLPYRGMDRIFDDIEDFMRIDSQPGRPRAYVVAIFDEQTGGLCRYVHRVMGSQQRVEITIDSFTADSPATQ
jgi:hypothetical protein